MLLVNDAQKAAAYRPSGKVINVQKRGKISQKLLHFVYTFQLLQN